MSLRGRWQIVETPDYDMGKPAYIVFRKTGGEFALGCLTGAIYGSCQGDAVEFTWEGNDEMEPAILPAIRMGFIPRIQDRPIVHRIDAEFGFHEISPL